MKDIDKIIVERRSVRSFNTSEPMTEKEADFLRREFAEAESPFGGRIAVELKKFDMEGAFKPSTYVTINGASWYFLMGTDSTEESQLSLG